MMHFQASADPVASIIVVAWRDAPYLMPCLQSVQENVTQVDFELILVLNEPSEDLRAQVEREIAGAKVHVFRSNLGFGGGVNFAARSANGRYLVLLNDDSVVLRGWLETLIETAERRPHCGLVGSRYLHPDGRLQEAGSVVWSDGSTSAFEAQGGPDWEFERQVDYCSGGSLLVRGDVWDRLGGFDDRYYPAYFEDIDLALRAKEIGWDTWFQPLSVIRHIRSGSSGRLHRFLYERSRARFVERWADVLESWEERGQYQRAAMRAMGDPLKVLVLDDRLPEASIGAGYGRMRDTLETLAADPTIHVGLHCTIEHRPDPGRLARTGIRVIADLARHLDQPGAGYDAVIISRPNNFIGYYEMLHERIPGACFIYDAESLFYRRLENQLVLERDRPERAALEAEAAEARRAEEWIFDHADSVVCISEEEAALVRQTAKGPVHVVEAWLSSPSPTAAGFEDRRDIGLVAGWAAGPGSPNSKGLLWFAHEVLPRVRAAIPGCRLLVTGGRPPADVTWLPGRYVEFLGHVQDLSAFYERVRVVVSPTQYGSGVKLKTIEAVQYGVPVVATSEAAAGLGPRINEAVWVTDDPAAFADAVVALHRDYDTWSELRRRQLEFSSAHRPAAATTGDWGKLVRDTVVSSRAQTGQVRT